MPKPGVNDVMGPDESYRERIVRVPLIKIVLPNPAGTSLEKYEPEYVVPLIVDLWRPKFAANPNLKPKIGNVPAHLPKYRDITSVEDEHGRLTAVYGTMKNSDESRVDHFLPGDRLWQEIKRCGGELVEREVGAHHSFHDESTVQKIPATAAPFDVLDELPFDLEMEGEESDREVETPESLEKAEAQRRREKERLAKMAEREAILAKRAQKERKMREADENAKAKLGEHKPAKLTDQVAEQLAGEDDGKGESIEPAVEDQAEIDAAEAAE